MQVQGSLMESVKAWPLLLLLGLHPNIPAHLMENILISEGFDFVPFISFGPCGKLLGHLKSDPKAMKQFSGGKKCYCRGGT